MVIYWKSKRHVEVRTRNTRTALHSWSTLTHLQQFSHLQQCSPLALFHPFPVPAACVSLYYVTSSVQMREPRVNECVLIYHSPCVDRILAHIIIFTTQKQCSMDLVWTRRRYRRWLDLCPEECVTLIFHFGYSYCRKCVDSIPTQTHTHIHPLPPLCFGQSPVCGTSESNLTQLRLLLYVNHASFIVRRHRHHRSQERVSSVDDWLVDCGVTLNHLMHWPRGGWLTTTCYTCTIHYIIHSTVLCTPPRSGGPHFHQPIHHTSE